MKKQEKGITLIALVITIIVLLILAGISIAMLTGENGILTKADTAAKETDIVETKEQIKLEIMGNSDESGNYTNKNVIDAVKKITDKDVEEEAETVHSKKGNEVDISDLWHIKVNFKIDGIPFIANPGETWMEWIEKTENLERCKSLQVGLTTNSQNTFDLLVQDASTIKTPDSYIDARMGGEDVGFECNGRLVYWGYYIIEADYTSNLLFDIFEDYDPSLGVKI